jgi:hypothetical protein
MVDADTLVSRAIAAMTTRDRQALAAADLAARFPAQAIAS